MDPLTSISSLKIAYYGTFTEELISKVAFRAFAELGVALALSALCIPFASSTLVLEMGKIALIGTIINAVTRLLLPSPEVPCSFNFSRR